MRPSWVVTTFDSQCRSRNSPGFDHSVLQHSGFWRAAGETVLNKVMKKLIKNIPLNYCKDKTCENVSPRYTWSWKGPPARLRWRWRCRLSTGQDPPPCDRRCRSPVNVPIWWSKERAQKLFMWYIKKFLPTRWSATTTATPRPPQKKFPRHVPKSSYHLLSTAPGTVLQERYLHITSNIDHNFPS